MFRKFLLFFMSILLVATFNLTVYANSNIDISESYSSFTIDENGNIIPIDTSYDYSEEKEKLKNQIDEQTIYNDLADDEDSYILGGGYTRSRVEVYGSNNYATKSSDGWKNSSLYNNTANSQPITSNITYSNSASYSYNFGLTSGELSLIKSAAFGFGVSNTSFASSSVTMTIPARMYGWVETRPFYINKWGYVVTDHYRIDGKITKTERKYFDVYYPSGTGFLNLEFRTKTSYFRPV